MSIVKIARNALAGTLIAALPLSSAIGAVRPSAAIPAAGSTAVAAQDGTGKSFSNTFIMVGALAILWGIAILVALDDDGEDDIELSRA